MASILVGTEYDFSALQDNDTTVLFSISDGALAYDLTDLNLTFYLKATRLTADVDAFTITPSVSAALLGQLSVTIPREQLTAAVADTSNGTLWYRIDAGSDGRVDTGCGTTLNNETVTDSSAAEGDLGESIAGENIPDGATITTVSAGTGYTISAEATSDGSLLTFTVGQRVATLCFGFITVLAT